MRGVSPTQYAHTSAPCTYLTSTLRWALSRAMRFLSAAIITFQRALAYSGDMFVMQMSCEGAADAADATNTTQAATIVLVSPPMIHVKQRLARDDRTATDGVYQLARL